MKKHNLTIKKLYLTFISVLTLTFFPLCVGEYQVLSESDPFNRTDLYSITPPPHNFPYNNSL